MAASMEVQASPSEDGSEGVLASAGSVGSVSVALHPLVIMNISEHYTRIKAQYGKPNPQVIGALLGTQDGRKIEIFNSFELQFDLFDDGQIVINMEYYRTKEEQCQFVSIFIKLFQPTDQVGAVHQVFKNLDFLGWYTTGGAPTENDIRVHKQMCEINESPLFLKLNPLAKSNDLPISMYESMIDILDGATRMLFVETHYTLATEEAERIGVDHVARLSSTGTVDSSTVSEHLLAQYNAIKMLHCRVKTILEYTKAVKNGEVPCNHEIMRDALSLIQRLPVMKTELFREDFYNQCNDVMLMCYLSTITKGANSLNEFINKFNVVYDRHGMGRRMRGTLF